MQYNRSIHALHTAGKEVTQGVREKLLLFFFCLFSLACAAYFLTTLRPVQASTNNSGLLPSVVAKGAQADSLAAPTSVSDVVAKALAFKALLTTTQQATLEQTYTTTLARRWSNL